MLETAAALTFGHALADFIMQTDEMVRQKGRPHVLLLHVCIVTLVSWAALGLPLEPLLLILVAVSHFVIDWLKLRHGGGGFGPFAIDQAAHLAVIVIGASLFPGAWDAGLWANAPGAFALLPQAMALGAGFVLAVWGGDYAVRALMSDLKPPDPASLPRGGRLIGRLERAMILMLVIAGQPDGIGFLIAAKSLLRFNDLAHDKDRGVSEYVIIGTLASFAWGLVVAFATHLVLVALGP
ncbi:DUF3307 domain-containing protein [Amaricoccus sp.]|uniref:DUF3307 domain-containing protein n=1 Tax=Amaricoccus sp. TaxID=1872485 RepID=UPI002603C66E|nr:DUF3307 domain-containing protein [Amaricoccus sp.]HRO13249.1 DUF3307 domain-containing protein [Amaricoccus sp.]